MNNGGGNMVSKERKEKPAPAGCEGMISMGAFAEVVGVSKQAVSKAVKAMKLTEGVSFKKSGNSYWFNEADAKAEWAVSIKVNQVKNPKLLEGLGVDPVSHGSNPALQAVKDMSLNEVKEETLRTELRLLLIEEEKQRGQVIDRAVVEGNLKSFGIEMRSHLTNIPGGITARMRNAKSDSEAENMLATAINEALNACADVLDKDIGA